MADTSILFSGNNKERSVEIDNPPKGMGEGSSWGLGHNDYLKIFLDPDTDEVPLRVPQCRTVV